MRFGIGNLGLVVGAELLDRVRGIGSGEGVLFAAAGVVVGGVEGLAVYFVGVGRVDGDGVLATAGVEGGFFGDGVLLAAGLAACLRDDEISGKLRRVKVPIVLELH